MKSYLDLVPISAKVRRKQNRMSVACIVLAVFLVTTIFGMADMYIRAQITQVTQDNGNFHVGVCDVTDEEAALIAERPDVAAVSRYGIIPYEENNPYTLFGHSLLVAGCDDTMMTDIIADAIVDGHFPSKAGEAMLTQNVHDLYGLQLGDAVTFTAPDGDTLTYTISGFCSDSAQTMSSDGFAVFLSTQDFRKAYAEAKGMDAQALTNVNLDDVNSALYVQFAHPLLARHSIADLKTDLGLSDEQVSENVKLLGLYGQSSNSELITIYISALVLGVLVLIAGIFMIASSLNTSVAQRTEFYGMMRCLGATPKQVMRLVRKEALRWCRLAIPVGVAIGVVLIWALCALLRALSPEYFADMPTFGVSLPAIVAGVLLGFLTVFFAARSPGKRAAKVSPLVAVSGNASDQAPVKNACNTRHLHVETALGIHHAKASKKNLVLMTSSFAFSIILFLCFSVAVDMMQMSLTSLKPWTADVSIVSQDKSCSVDAALLDELADDDAVERAFGRMFAYNVPVEDDDRSGSADLVSYEANQFDWAKDYLLEGDLQAAETEQNAVLAVYGPKHPLAVGDTLQVTVNGQVQKLTVVGLLSASPFDGSTDFGTLVCSENTFQALTGADAYTVIDLQLAPNVSDAQVNAIRAEAGEGVTFVDNRLGNASARGTYYCFWIFVYGFLAIIALMTVFNIVNSVAMSVAARTKQYGVFRALGLSGKQLSRMVVAEAITYTVLGVILGTALGLVGHYILYHSLITSMRGIAWTMPWDKLLTILVIMVLSVVLAVVRPLKQLRAQSIVDTLAEH
ncbi:MAG: FtsX-like permease family protein [Peptococcaceae bacterium]|nr:FtsX-like permease family protein [Peptococcaceae bacterium]